MKQYLPHNPSEDARDDQDMTQKSLMLKNLQHQILSSPYDNTSEKVLSNEGHILSR